MLALVTGASSGIGLKYANQLAAQGHDLVVVSNQQQELDACASDIAERYAVRVIPVFSDLTRPEAADELMRYCVEHDLEVDILICNAGVFFFNYLIDTAMPRIERMLELHVLATTRLVRLFGRQMADRNSYLDETTDADGHVTMMRRAKPKADRRPGYIVCMSSMSAWMAMPGIQCYNATKAYINNFARSMWHELRPYGVEVLSVTPGAVDTGLYGLSMPLRRLAVALHVSVTPDRLVQKVLRAMYKGRKRCMPGLVNYLAMPLVKHCPDWIVRVLYRYIDQFMK